MNSVDLNLIAISQEILQLVPSAIAKRLSVLPLYIKNNILFAAMAHEDFHVTDQLETITGLSVEILEVESQAILTKTIHRYYPDSASPGTAPAVILLDRILNLALQQRVSDIHINPIAEQGEIKFRIDGQLRLIENVSSLIINELITVLKVMAHLDIAEKRTPLDGNINHTVSGEEICMRAATMPTVHGEKMTLRLLSQDKDGYLAELTKLGMDQQDLSLFKSALDSPNGIILLSGPTGSGKTTTLYAALRQLRLNGDRHLVSIEDPVEVQVEGVTQIPVDSDKDRLSFARALRGVLRHDPDVIMVGEIRDAETADIAVKSALTGHLVIATLHANNAIGVITRMIDLGVSPYLLASTLRLTIAQRLVRQPCRHCMTWENMDSESLNLLYGVEKESTKYPIANGCPICAESGYSGRVAIYEMIEPDFALKKMINSQAAEDTLSEYVFETMNIKNLLNDGLQKAEQGLITTRELIKATQQ